MMRTQLKVIKTDGTVEEYFHTKVIGAINNALGLTDQMDISLAERFAEVVTYYVYHRQDHRSITSSEIFSIIKVVLAATGYQEAAIALSEHHFERKLKRSRVEVASIDVRELTDAELLAGTEEPSSRYPWNKSRIVRDLITKHDLHRQTARTIAAMVEEKIVNMGVTLVPSSLVRQLVLGDAAIVLRAQRQLQSV
jgi:transcriptional regulator NrdR family protein